ncbi:hypothetical protein Sm713_44090 [Streptomyces sp. TS71-3]|nr:hypothetical protein Sm713_44090 [Streptomyces sp. TS71-3]
MGGQRAPGAHAVPARGLLTQPVLTAGYRAGRVGELSLHTGCEPGSAARPFGGGSSRPRGGGLSLAPAAGAVRVAVRFFAQFPAPLDTALRTQDRNG